MIKKFYFVMAIGALAALTACGNKAETATDNQEQTEEVAQSETSPANAQSEEQVISELMEMYANTMDMKETYMTSDLRNYVSSADHTAWKKGDEMGWLDYDKWTFSQDPDNSAKEVKNVTFPTDSTATADVYGGGFGPQGFVTVTVQLVDGHYLIDDIVATNSESIKTQAKKYLGED